jgi:hypothetical protein
VPIADSRRNQEYFEGRVLAHTSAWNDGGNTYGIRIVRKKRQQFVNQTWNHAELEIDDTVHQIPVTAGPWKHCPEIRRPIIRDWLCRHKSLS